MKPLRVLLVEDEAILRIHMQQRLRAAGAEVVASCASGEEAMRLAVQARPDLALLDIRLSGTATGLDVADFILSETGCRCVLLSAYDPGDLERLPSGERYLGFWSKPIGPRELEKILELAAARPE